MLDFDTLPRVPDLIYLRLHLVQVPLQSLLTLLVSEFNFFEALCQFLFLLLLGNVRLVQLFGPFCCRCQIFEMHVQFLELLLHIGQLVAQGLVQRDLVHLGRPDSAVVPLHLIKQVIHGLLEHEKVKTSSLYPLVFVLLLPRALLEGFATLGCSLCRILYELVRLVDVFQV